MSLHRLLSQTTLCSALAFSVTGLAAHAQVEITDDRTEGVSTSTADNGSPADVTVTSDGSITVTTGPAVTVDSDNDVDVAGALRSEDSDDTTGILIQGGNTGSVNLSGTISLTEDFTPEDTDDDAVVDGPFAQGSGRTGILISGASPFTGDVTAASGSTILVESNDGAGIQLANMSMLDGNLTSAGRIDVIGDNAVGIDLQGSVSGDVTISGNLTTRGENASSVIIGDDVGGQVSFTGNINNSGYRFPTRVNSVIRERFDAEDTLQAGSAFVVNGNVDGGVLVAATRNEDGAVTARPTINQAGSAAAILISGDGTPILIGLATDITDPADENYEARLQYGLVQEAQVSATGTIDDVSATALEVSDVTITGGINNTGSLTTSTFRSGVPVDGTANVAGDVAHAYGVRLESGGNVSRFDNSGTVRATAAEASDVIFNQDGEDLAPNDVNATAINIASGAVLTELNNSGIISAVLTGRTGTAYAIIDQSGTLAVINNEGQISAGGQSSDPNFGTGSEAPVFTLVAIDVSTNTSGVTITQSQLADDDPDDALTPNPPLISGDVRLGSGNDTVTASAGFIVGNITTGAGSDEIRISGENTQIIGSVFDSDGDLELVLLDGAVLTYLDPIATNLTNATFGTDTTFNPIIDGSTGLVSTLTASGSITFQDGATITPVLANIIGAGGTYVIAEAGTLSVNAELDGFRPENAPYLYNTSIGLDPTNSNRLIATFARRSTTELGLDTPQSQAFEAAFEAMQADSGLGGAFARITDQDSFFGAYNQILPEFAAAAGRFVHSNVDGSTGAVANHLSSARYSDDKPGGAWIQEFAYFADKEFVGLSDAYRGYGFGFSGGIDTEFGPFHTAGINLSFSATEVEDVLGIDDPLSINTLQGGLYGGLTQGNFFVDSYIGGGWSAFENRRQVTIGSFSGQAEGEWSAWHYNASVTAGYDAPVGEKFFLRPSLNVSYLNLSEQSYIEDGNDSIRLRVEDRDSTLGTATAFVDFGAKFGDDRIWYRPSVRLGYRTEFANDPVTTTAFFANTGTPFSLSSAEFPDSGFILGVTFMAGSAYSSFGFDYDADLRDGYNRHTARIVLRMQF